MLLVVEYVIGGLAVILTIFAYMQHNVISYLKVNIFAASAFSLTLIFNGGFIGGGITLLTVLLYIVAIYTSKKTRKLLSYYIPPIAFIIAYYGYDFNNSYITLSNIEFTIATNYLPAIGTLFITLGSLQTKILLNKIFLVIGLFSWAAYSFYLNAWFALAADTVGILTLIISIFYIRLNIEKQLPCK